MSLLSELAVSVIVMIAFVACVFLVDALIYTYQNRKDWWDRG